MTISEFEGVVLSQKRAEKPWEPVTDYSFEGRRNVEGRHPKLIMEAFRPKRILDVGCGPKHLVRLLNELAGHTIAFGMDRDNHDADYLLDITSEHLHRQRRLGGDLVICREVLEHLTLQEIAKAVRNLCCLSTRFVYVTTRFSSEHDLLHVQTSDDLDPTHITIPSKDLIRLLFVLEGFKRRADLEERLDWQRKNRCLVYERAA